MAKQELEAYKHLQRQHNGDLSEGDSSQGVTEYCTCMCIHQSQLLDTLESF